MRTTIAENHPMIRAINPQAWSKRTDYRDLGFRPSFDPFVRQRTELLALSGPLPPESWLRTAIVMGAGSSLEPTVQAFGNLTARHERAHVTHVERFVAALRREATGDGR